MNDGEYCAIIFLHLKMEAMETSEKNNFKTKQKKLFFNEQTKIPTINNGNNTLNNA